MTTTTITSNHRLRRRFGFTILAAALISAAACGSPAASNPEANPAAAAAPGATAARVRPTETVDESIGVEGERVHVRCRGRGATTVLLIAGFQDGSGGWARVEAAISERTRVCSYDRPGTGASDPAASTATFATQATDLHALLATIGEPGPYVVVGHSFGGAQAVTFASLYSDEVSGLVLVDASPVTWPAAICAVSEDGSDAAMMLRGFCDGLSDPNGNREHLDVFASFAGASRIASLGSLPMAVITAVDRQVPAGLAAEELARLTEVWNSGQQQWSQLSTAARVVSVEDTSHYIQLDHPDVVVDEITRLLP